jgi:hypothetical protein
MDFQKLFRARIRTYEKGLTGKQPALYALLKQRLELRSVGLHER